MNIPPPLMTSEVGSFAQSTIKERKPQIIRQVKSLNSYPLEIENSLGSLLEEICAHQIIPLRENVPDVVVWNSELEKYQDKTWLEIPWFFAETFFYRRLLEAVRYFQPGDWFLKNPFQKQKQMQVTSDNQKLSMLWENIFELTTDKAFEVLLYSSLWGNRVDLSHSDPTEHTLNGFLNIDDHQNILINNIHEVQTYLENGVERVDFINDNVGVELFFDLALADFLVREQWAQRIVFHLKKCPYFVSDAMPQDIYDVIALLQASSQLAARQFGDRLEKYFNFGRLDIEADPFWTSWKMFRQMPLSIRQTLANSNLVIIKGDANYRRLLDDAHWPPTTRMEDVASYFPSQFVTLRTLKAEIIVGLKSDQVETLKQEDPGWMINGRRGVIHYVIPSQLQ